MAVHRLLGLFAHPDDEIFAAGLLALRARAGAEVLVVSATSGEAGRARGADLSREALAQLRRAELAASCAAIGCDHLVWEYPDGGLSGVDEWEGAGRVLELVRERSFDSIVTFGIDGAYGHRDHIACWSWAHAANLYLDAGVEIYHLAFPRGLFAGLHRALRRVRGVPIDQSLRPGELGREPIDLVLRLELTAELKRVKTVAIEAHASQLEDGRAQSFLSATISEQILSEEWYA